MGPAKAMVACLSHPLTVKKVSLGVRRLAGNAMVGGILVGPILVFILGLAAWWMSCWLILLPGVACLCMPACLWAAREILELWRHWDGRAQLVEDWPAFQLLRTSCFVL